MTTHQKNPVESWEEELKKLDNGLYKNDKFLQYWFKNLLSTQREQLLTELLAEVENERPLPVGIGSDYAHGHTVAIDKACFLLQAKRGKI